jgi:predicted transcriptional regulator
MTIISEYVLDSKTTLRLPENILRELKHLAIDDNRTLTEIVIEALNQYLDKRGKKR